MFYSTLPTQENSKMLLLYNHQVKIWKKKFSNSKFGQLLWEKTYIQSSHLKHMEKTFFCWEVSFFIKKCDPEFNFSASDFEWFFATFLQIKLFDFAVFFTSVSLKQFVQFLGIFDQFWSNCYPRRKVHLNRFSKLQKKKLKRAFKQQIEGHVLSVIFFRGAQGEHIFRGGSKNHGGSGGALDSLCFPIPPKFSACGGQKTLLRCTGGTGGSPPPRPRKKITLNVLA